MMMAFARFFFLRNSSFALVRTPLRALLQVPDSLITQPRHRGSAHRNAQSNLVLKFRFVSEQIVKWNRVWWIGRFGTKWAFQPVLQEIYLYVPNHQGRKRIEPWGVANWVILTTVSATILKYLSKMATTGWTTKWLW